MTNSDLRAAQQTEKPQTEQQPTGQNPDWQADRQRDLDPGLARRLYVAVAEKQAEWRAASVAAAVVRHGRPIWHGMVGTADAEHPGVPPTADTQFRMGSITKTFTAVLVLQCRDDGLLALDDRLDQHIATARHGGLTIRRMLSHLSGLQREPVGEIWDRPEGPNLDELLTRLDEAEAVLAPGLAHHYSNLAYSLLGEVVARLRGQSWEQALQRRILQPLEMTRTTARRRAPHARGYFADPYADRLHEEKEFPGGAFAPAAELWTTVDDLARWATFLADPRPGGILSADTVEEMCAPRVIYDPDAWTLAWGLGWMLFRRGERILAGHTGAMPGFLAATVVRRPQRTGAVVLVNTSAGADPAGLALDLACQVLDADPDLPEPFLPAGAITPELEELLGPWWFEGTEHSFSARDGKLEIRVVGSPRATPPAVLAIEGPGVLRGVSGRERGELLRVVRREDGSIDRLLWATYTGTRRPALFGQ